VPLFAVDFAGMKGSYVGESERAFREAVRVVDAVAGGRSLVVATCNNLDVLPSALRRRFAYGTWYCDLPSEGERAAIWGIQAERTGLELDPPPPSDVDWTGAEIRSCCEIARALEISLEDAARYIVPLATSDPEGIESLRRSAQGRWTSASTGEIYRRELAPAGSSGRVLDLTGAGIPTKKGTN
jgi:hypothetical protein